MSLDLDKDENDTTWMPISDLMAGLMMIFLLIAVSFTQNIDDEQPEKQEEIAELPVEELLEEPDKVADLTIDPSEVIKMQIRNAFVEKFQGTLDSRCARLDESELTITFSASLHYDATCENVFFEKGQSELTQYFKNTLSKFIPVLVSHVKQIDGSHDDFRLEIQIQGHTSSEWGEPGITDREAFINNMELSQDRARKVLDYSLQLESMPDELVQWMLSQVTANGFAAVKRITRDDGTEDRQQSRRVEFTVLIFHRPVDEYHHKQRVDGIVAL